MKLNEFLKQLTESNADAKDFFFAVSENEKEDESYHNTIYAIFKANEIKLPQNCRIENSTIICSVDNDKERRIEVKPIMDVPAKEIVKMKAPEMLGGQKIVDAIAQEVHAIDSKNAKGIMLTDKELRAQILDILGNKKDV